MVNSSAFLSLLSQASSLLSSFVSPTSPSQVSPSRFSPFVSHARFSPSQVSHARFSPHVSPTSPSHAVLARFSPFVSPTWFLRLIRFFIPLCIRFLPLFLRRHCRRFLRLFIILVAQVGQWRFVRNLGWELQVIPCMSLCLVIVPFSLVIVCHSSRIMYCCEFASSTGLQ
jgi:hypothetical protein